MNEDLKRLEDDEKVIKAVISQKVLHFRRCDQCDEAFNSEWSVDVAPKVLCARCARFNRGIEEMIERRPKQ